MNERLAAQLKMWRLAPWRQRWQSIRIQARRALPFAVTVFAVLAILWLYRIFFPPPSPLTAAELNETIAQALAAATPPPTYSSLVYQAIMPSMVLIEVQHEDERGRKDDGLGSGVVVNQKGDILTSLHVVAHTATIQLTFADGSKSSAQVIATQPENDIAVLHPNQPPKLIVPATLGNPRAMNVGDDAFVVGHPLGLYASMSAGIISGFDRSFTPQKSEQRLKGLIQIDAAVNPGNSGGPLLNRSGQVVGIITGLVNPTDQNVFIGIGFAVPINVAGGAAGLPPY